MRTRKFDFLDTNTGEAKYSFQVKVEAIWKFVSKGGQPAIYDTEKQRDDARKEASRKK